MAEACLISGLVGSHAYGTELPDSDIDTMKVYAADVTCYLGVDSFGQQGTRQYKLCPVDGFESETVEYEVIKYIRLCCNFNPNVIPLLYLSDYIEVSSLGQELINNRKIFNSRKAYTAFCGMADNQIAKMTNGDTTGEMGAKRKAIRAEHGFDRKHALHAIRLQRTLLEFLECDGETMNVKRTKDREELMAIRLGPVTLPEIQKMSQDLNRKVQIAIGKSGLPDNVDRDVVNEFCVGLMRKVIA
jgi:predicted nucleotidyltransferase